MDSTRRGHADPQPVFALRAAPVTLPLRLVWLRRSICALTGFGATAFATKGLPSRSLRSKRRIGGPGRTRTCNQTVMSGNSRRLEGALNLQRKIVRIRGIVNRRVETNVNYLQQDSTGLSLIEKESTLNEYR